ncbi:DJ-1/PfpI family protein [Streptomyces sp. NPDC003077]|uniref:DJ-1/PfpI family protein n=1 Tax=Streptomyces sp. NPDC003077 TaxID=3154443 RepID=UPI0033AB3A20
MERRDFLRSATAGTATLAAAGTLTATTAQAATTAAERTAAERTATAAAASRRKGPWRVHIVMFDGVEELDFAAPYEIFSAAGMHSPHGVEVRYVTAGAPGTVRGAYGTSVRVDHGWAPHQADVIVVPGGGYRRRNGPGVWAEIDRGVLPRALAAAPRRGLTISSLCTGAILLSAAGLTKGRPCTTHHGAKDELRARGGVVKDARVVDDGDLVTAGGISSGLELGLWLVRRELGADAAIGVETMTEYEARGTVWTSAMS